MNFIYDERYKTIVKKYVDAMERKENQLKADVKTERIKQEADEKLAQIAEDLKSFYDNRMNEIERGKKEIVKAYKQRGKEYNDPQAEVLRRQDFEMELAVADDHELEDIAKDTDRELSKYEINKLQVEFKKRDLSSIDMVRQRIDVKEAHETDPKYQALEAEAIQLLHVKPKARATENWILTASKDGERPQFNQLGDLKNYNQNSSKVSDLKEGYDELERQISSKRTAGAKLNPIITKEAEDYVDELIATGKHKTLKKYEDVDLRAIEGSKEYDLADEYNYLKERYADPTNKMYTFQNPDYSVGMHLDYLRKQHEIELEKNPQLKDQIKNALNSDETEEETTE